MGHKVTLIEACVEGISIKSHMGMHQRHSGNWFPCRRSVNLRIGPLAVLILELRTNAVHNYCSNSKDFNFNFEMYVEFKRLRFVKQH